MRDAEPRVFVCRPGFSEAASGLCERTGVPNLFTLGAAADGTLADLAGEQLDVFDDAPRSSGDLAAVLYTSGTTGRSKGAMLTHSNLATNAEALIEAWRFTPQDVLLHALPIYHTHGLFVASNVALMSAGSMLFLPKYDPDEIFRLLPRATVMMGVPTFYTRLLDDPRLTREAAALMRLFISGSAPLLEDTHRGFMDRTGHAILERYGMTETGMNTSNPYDGDRAPGTVGLPLRNVEVRIAHPETGETLGQDEIGMIEVRGPNVFKGYWRMPEKTQAEFREDGFFITGDLGKIDARGYVHILGRGKDLVISGGFNVYPKEVESEIDALPGVVESAVIGRLTRTLARASSLSSCWPRTSIFGRRTSSRRLSCGLPITNYPSGCSSPMAFRATPWAKFRRTCFAMPMAICSASGQGTKPKRTGLDPLCSGRRLPAPVDGPAE